MNTLKIVKKSSTGFAGIYILIGLVILAIIGGVYYLGIRKNSPVPTTPRACTQEAKICPDGSSVGRTGPNCEFSPCSVAKTSSNSAGLANPASVNCLQKGGNLEIRTFNGGQGGICKFTDGTECEEWAYMNNKCQPGQYRKWDETASWKTFNSSDNSFSFKYPEDRYVQDVQTNPSLPGEKGSMSSVYTYFCPSKDRNNCVMDNSFIVDNYENVDNLDLETWLRQSTYSPGVTLKSSCIENDPNTKISKGTFLSKDAYIYEFQITEQITKEGCSNSMIRFEVSGNYKYIILKDNRNILFLQIFSHTSSLKPELDQILSTFKFN